MNGTKLVNTEGRVLLWPKFQTNVYLSFMAKKKEKKIEGSGSRK